MQRTLAHRIRNVEHAAAHGRADSYILAERVRHATGDDLPRDQWCFIRDQGFVPFASAARAAHRLLSLILDRPPPLTDDAWWLVDDILWYMNHDRRWRPDQGWDVLWRFQRRVLPNLPANPIELPTAIWRDLTTVIGQHDPQYAPPFRPRAARRRPHPPARYTPPEQVYPPSMRIDDERRTQPSFFQEPEPPKLPPDPIIELMMGNNPDGTPRTPPPDPPDDDLPPAA